MYERGIISSDYLLPPVQQYASYIHACVVVVRLLFSFFFRGCGRDERREGCGGECEWLMRLRWLLRRADHVGALLYLLLYSSSSSEWEQGVEWDYSRSVLYYLPSWGDSTYVYTKVRRNASSLQFFSRDLRFRVRCRGHQPSWGGSKTFTAVTRYTIQYHSQRIYYSNNNNSSRCPSIAPAGTPYHSI